MERLIIGTQGTQWKDKGDIPVDRHCAQHWCHSFSGGVLGRSGEEGSPVVM